MLEVLMAVFIFLIVIVMTMGFWTTCAKYIVKNRARALGTYVAEQALENAVSAGFDNVETYVGQRSYGLDATMNGRPFRYAVDYELTVVPVTEKLKSIQVKVKWDEQGGEARYETLLSSEN